MKSQQMVGIFLVILSVTSPAWSFQEVGVPRQGGVGNWNAAPAVQPRAPVPQPGMGAGAPPAALSDGSAGYGVQDQGAYPQYPYPPYPNPFYNSQPAGNFASNSLDWLLNLPSNLLGRVGDYLDATFFPQTPATSGGAPAQPAGQVDRPLPPAPGYDAGRVVNPR